MGDQGSGSDRRTETARLLSLQAEEVDYLGGDLPANTESTTEDEPPAGDENVPEIEIAAAESRGLVVPNRISYGVYLQPVGFDGNRQRWAWMNLRDTCTHTFWTYIWSDSINRWERAGWCRRPQTDAYDIRWKIYWRA